MMSNLPAWQRWTPRIGALTATITTICCLGVGVAISLATAIGATFLTQDAVLRPLLAATLLLTAAGSALTWRGHRNPIPLIVTVLSGAGLFLAIFGPGLWQHTVSADGHEAGHSGANLWAWAA
jgi:hypothetical protein